MDLQTRLTELEREYLRDNNILTEIAGKKGTKSEVKHYEVAQEIFAIKTELANQGLHPFPIKIKASYRCMQPRKDHRGGGKK